MIFVNKVYSSIDTYVQKVVQVRHSLRSNFQIAICEYGHRILHHVKGLAQPSGNDTARIIIVHYPAVYRHLEKCDAACHAFWKEIRTCHEDTTFVIRLNR